MITTRTCFVYRRSKRGILVSRLLTPLSVTGLNWRKRIRRFLPWRRSSAGEVFDDHRCVPGSSSIFMCGDVMFDFVFVGT